MMRGRIAFPWRSQQWRYAFKAYGYLPVTFFRRVVVGRDPYWRRYFWSRWGFLSSRVARKLAGGPVLWLDAISGGEVLQIVSFCLRLRDALPGWRFVLSTNNRYSYDFASQGLAVDAILDSPWDLKGPVRRMLRAIRPKAVVCIENLSAPVLVREAHRFGIQTLLVSGLLSKDFHRHPIMHRTMELCPFRDLDWLGAKSEEDVRGFIAMGVQPGRVVVTGNMKFDLEFLRVPDEQRIQLFDHLGLTPDRPVLLAASLHPGEDRFVGEAFLSARLDTPDLRLVVVPRYQFHADSMIRTFQSMGLSVVRRTARIHHDPPDVIVVDTFGELSRLYAVASVVFIGGSTYLRNVVGLGQNIVEPLVQAKPMFFGTYMNLWRDITEELKKVWPGIEVMSSGELGVGLREVLKSSVLRGRLQEKAREIVDRHKGDVQRNVDLVVDALSPRKRDSIQYAKAL